MAIDSSDPPSETPSAETSKMLAVMPSRALAIRRTCVFVHRWDISRRACEDCGVQIYVEVRIS